MQHIRPACGQRNTARGHAHPAQQPQQLHNARTQAAPQPIEQLSPRLGQHRVNKAAGAYTCTRMVLLLLWERLLIGRLWMVAVRPCLRWAVP